MATHPTRIVDAHVHLWDPARTDWYPYLAHIPQEGGGDPLRMHRFFDTNLYRSESARWNVEKFINVAAATGRHSVEETIELDHNAAAAGGSDAIIGGLPPTDSVGESLAAHRPPNDRSPLRRGPPDGPVGSAAAGSRDPPRPGRAEPGLRIDDASRRARVVHGRARCR